MKKYFKFQRFRPLYAHQVFFETRSPFLAKMFEMIRSRHSGERISITLANTERLLARKMIEIVYQGKTLLGEDELDPMKNLLASLGLDISTDHCQSLPGPSVQGTEENQPLRITRYLNVVLILN